MLVSKELINEILGDELKRECSLNYRITNIKIRNSSVVIEYIDCNNFTHTYEDNIHELAHKILDYAVSKKYVASLVKVKEFWYCEYDTEEHYKYNGTMRKGQEDTKSDNPLKSASIMGQWIYKANR